MNVFVARFLGSPSINLIRARAESRALRCAAGSIPIPPERSPAVPPGEEVLVGARPEDVRISLGGAPGALEGRVYVVEPTGPETYVTIELPGGDRVACRAEAGFAARPGEPASVALEPGRLHFFDPRTERRLGA